MSYSEFKQLTDCVKQQSQEIDQLYEELEIVQKYRALFETQPTPKLSIHVANSSLGKSRRVLSMRENNYQRSQKTRN